MQQLRAHNLGLCLLACNLFCFGNKRGSSHHPAFPASPRHRCHSQPPTPIQLHHLHHCNVRSTAFQHKQACVPGASCLGAWCVAGSQRAESRTGGEAHLQAPGVCGRSVSGGEVSWISLQRSFFWGGPTLCVSRSGVLVLFQVVGGLLGASARGEMWILERPFGLLLAIRSKSEGSGCRLQTTKIWGLQRGCVSVKRQEIILVGPLVSGLSIIWPTGLVNQPIN